MNWVKLGIFAGGVAFGSVGLKLLGSKDAKKVYAQVTAATLRAKESVMKTVTNVKENAGDILADAKDINESVTLRMLLSKTNVIVTAVAKPFRKKRKN
ncbi:MAG: DUF6110 family protein [[Eubacterium] siraeum]